LPTVLAPASSEQGEGSAVPEAPSVAGEESGEFVGSDVAPDVSGRVVVSESQSGLELRLQVTGLPSIGPTETYRVWMANCDDSLRLPVGSYTNLSNASGAAEGSIKALPRVLITIADLAPPDGVEPKGLAEPIAAADLGAWCQ
jgi:hypothetical protein